MERGRSDVLLNQREVNVGADGDVEGALLVGLVGSGHNDVPVRVSIQHELLKVLAPRNELQRIFIQYVVFRWLDVSRVDVETNHGSDKSHSDLFLPGLLRPAESNFDCCRVPSLKLEEELGVLHPSALVNIVFKLFVVEMAASSTALRLPLRGENDILAISELLNLHGLRRVN